MSRGGLNQKESTSAAGGVCVGFHNLVTVSDLQRHSQVGGHPLKGLVQLLLLIAGA